MHRVGGTIFQGGGVILPKQGGGLILYPPNSREGGNYSLVGAFGMTHFPGTLPTIL